MFWLKSYQCSFIYDCVECSILTGISNKEEAQDHPELGSGSRVYKFKTKNLTEVSNYKLEINTHHLSKVWKPIPDLNYVVIVYFIRIKTYLQYTEQLLTCVYMWKR